MKAFLKLYLKSFNLLNNNLLQLLAISIIDLITLFVAVFTLNLFGTVIANPLTEFLVNLPNPAAPQSNAPTILIVAFITMYSIIYLLLTFLQPLSWQYIFNLLETKHNYKKIMKSLLLPNFFFVLLLALVNLYQDIFHTINTITGIRVIDPTFLFASYVVLMLLLLYFHLISFSTLTSVRKSIMFALRNIKQLLLPFITILITFVVVNYIMLASSWIHYSFNLILGVLLFVPAITFARLYFILSVKNL
jgi:hypothetical protein